MGDKSQLLIAPLENEIFPVFLLVVNFSIYSYNCINSDENLSQKKIMINTSVVILRLDRGIQAFSGFLDTRLRPAGMTGTTSLIL